MIRIILTVIAAPLLIYSCTVSDQRPIDEPVDNLPVMINKEMQLHYFPGSREISDNGEILLDSVASFLAVNPDLSVHLVGHAWDEGQQQDMIDLSFDRTKEVRDYLNARGVSSRRITMSGKGNDAPVYPDNEARSEYNRRVVIIVNDFK